MAVTEPHGQTTWMDGAILRGKGGWPGSSEIVVRLTLEGEGGPGGGGKSGRRMSDNEGDVAGDDSARSPVSTPEMGCPMRKMRTAVVGVPVVVLSDGRKSAVGRPLLVGALDAGDECNRDPVHCCRECGPVDFARFSVPVVSGIQFLVVAEVHSSAMDLVDDTLIVRTHEQQSSGREDPRKPPGIVDRPVMSIRSGAIRAFGSRGGPGGAVRSGTVRAFGSDGNPRR